jgi:parallel beta-helix repeat protein
VRENSGGIVVASDGNTLNKNKVGDKGQGNDGQGIAITGDDNEVKENQIFANTGAGIWVTGSGNYLLKNKVGEKGKGNGGAGVWVQGNTNTLTENDVFANSGDGMTVNGNGNVLKKNDVGDKGKGNGGNGIVVTGSGNGEPDPVEVEENTVKANARAGIVIHGAGHELKKNQSGGKGSGVTNGGCEYVIAAGNLDKKDNKADDAKFSFGSSGVACGGSL